MSDWKQQLASGECESKNNAAITKWCWGDASAAARDEPGVIKDHNACKRAFKRCRNDKKCQGDPPLFPAKPQGFDTVTCLIDEESVKSTWGLTAVDGTNQQWQTIQDDSGKWYYYALNAKGKAKEGSVSRSNPLWKKNLAAAAANGTCPRKNNAKMVEWCRKTHGLEGESLTECKKAVNNCVHSTAKSRKDTSPHPKPPPKPAVGNAGPPSPPKPKPAPAPRPKPVQRRAPDPKPAISPKRSRPTETAENQLLRVQADLTAVQRQLAACISEKSSYITEMNGINKQLKTIDNLNNKINTSLSNFGSARALTYPRYKKIRDPVWFGKLVKRVASPRQ